MAPRRDALKRAFDDVRDHVMRAAEKIRADQRRRPRPSCPSSTTPTSAPARSPTRRAPRSARAAAPWSAASSRQRRRANGSTRSAAISKTTHYEEKEVEKRSLDKYFSALKAGKPQIFNVYWSKPQVKARQDQKLAETRSFLDRLWTNYEGVFDPDLQCTYADRVRRRQPGDKTLGLSPHMDAGTVERWIDPGYQRGLRARLRRRLARLRSLRRDAPPGDARDPLARRGLASSAPTRAGRRSPARGRRTGRSA